MVVDASVAVKWLLPEKDSSAALRLIQSGLDLYAPELIRTEVAAALSRKVRNGEALPAEGELAVSLWLRSLEKGVLALVPEDQYLDAAWRMSVELNHPLQDCLYLALAGRLDLPLATADRKFAARAAGRPEQVLLLSAL
jgi:predicted nucleic acid-binding protein